MALKEIFERVGGHQLNMHVDEVEKLIGDIEFSQELHDELKELDPKEISSDSNLERIAGMLAGRHCHESTLINYFGFGCSNIVIENGVFNNYAFDSAIKCNASGEFGKSAFEYASDCRAKGYFDAHAFRHAENCRASGEFGPNAFTEGARSCWGSGKFKVDTRYSQTQTQVFCPGDIIFATEIEGFLPCAKSVVIYKHGKLDADESCEQYQPHVDAIIIGIGYNGDSKFITPIRAEDVPEMDALMPDFAQRAMYVVNKAGIQVPEWLAEAAKIIKSNSYF